jgi:hypothetical protein
MSARHTLGLWVIRVISTGEGNNRVFIRMNPVFVADDRKTFDASWYARLGSATKVYKLRRNAERWLAERPGVQGVVEEDPRVAAYEQYLARRAAKAKGEG